MLLAATTGSTPATAELAESGIIGLIGFTALQAAVAAAGVRRRRNGPLVAAAVGIVAGELLHGMVDIYWAAGVVTLPFVVMGIALATRAGDELDRSAPTLSPRAVTSHST